MPRLRRLRDPQRHEKDPLHAGHPAGEAGLRLRHRLFQPLSLLHEHLWHPFGARTRAGHCHRPEGHAARPLGVGHHRRWRRPEHRRQSPDPRPAAKPGHQHHPLQQPHLRPDQRTVLADEPPGPRDQEHPLGRDRQPAAHPLGGHRLRSHVRRADHRRLLQTPGHGPAARRRTPRHLLRRGLSELRRVQRRGLRICQRTRDQGRHHARTGARTSARVWQESRPGHPAQGVGAGSRHPGQRHQRVGPAGA